jgi:hypothetical protein
MSGDLTTSAIARQNILNNPYALAEIEKAAGIRSIPFENQRVVLKEQVADFFEVGVRTIENYIERNEQELVSNGYEIVRGKRLKELKKTLLALEGTETDFGTLKTASVLAVFNFRAFLNLAMLLSDSERARLLRKTILDIAIDTVQARSGGTTKYINQRDDDYLSAAYTGFRYRRKFTDALKEYVELNAFSYSTYTDKVYRAIFLEQAKQYKKVLSLGKKDSVRSTFYSEILGLVASYENGLAEELKKAFTEKGSKLTTKEADEIFNTFASHPMLVPLVELAREKMATRDLALRGAFHEKLEKYVSSMPREDFEKFLGEQTKELDKRLDEAKDVLKRLKDR